jgi:hypothetical protein
MTIIGDYHSCACNFRSKRRRYSFPGAGRDDEEVLERQIKKLHAKSEQLTVERDR